MADRRVDDATRARWDKIEKAYATHLRELTLAVQHTGDTLRRIIWGLIILVLVGLAGGYYFVTRNAEAIRVSCTIISNAVVESGAAGEAAQGLSEAGRLQQEITARYIMRIPLTKADIAYVLERKKRIEALGGVVTLPKCKKIARDPGSVQDLYERQRDKRPTPTVTTPTVTAP